MVKVLVEPETENPAQADGHIGVAGKVKVDLKAEGQQAHPAARRCQRPGSLGRQLGIPQSADGVGQQHFFSKAHAEPAGSQGKVLRAVDPVIQVLRHGLVLDDRPCDQLREHGDEGAEADDVPLHRGILPVDVDGVAHGLEGKEGNADWQWDIPQRDGDSQQGQAGGQAEPGQQKQVVRQEVPILEKAQKQQVEYHRLRHEPPGLFVVVPVLLHQQAVGIVNEDGEEHDDDIDRLAPTVEKQAHQQQRQIPPAQGRQKISRQRQRQIGK